MNHLFLTINKMRNKSNSFISIFIAVYCGHDTIFSLSFIPYLY